MNMLQLAVEQRGMMQGRKGQGPGRAVCGPPGSGGGVCLIEGPRAESMRGI